MFGGRDGNQRLEWLSRGVNDVNGGRAFKMLPMKGGRKGEKSPAESEMNEEEVPSEASERGLKQSLQIVKTNLKRETWLFITEMLHLIKAMAWGREVCLETGKSPTGSQPYHFQQTKRPQNTKLEYLPVLSKAQYIKFLV